MLGSDSKAVRVCVWCLFPSELAFSFLLERDGVIALSDRDEFLETVDVSLLSWPELFMVFTRNHKNCYILRPRTFRCHTHHQQERNPTTWTNFTTSLKFSKYGKHQGVEILANLFQNALQDLLLIVFRNYCLIGLRWRRELKLLNDWWKALRERACFVLIIIPDGTYVVTSSDAGLSGGMLREASILLYNSQISFQTQIDAGKI